MSSRKTRQVWVFLGVAASHFALTVILSFAAWALQAASSPSGSIAQQPLRAIVLGLSWVLNFPIPFLLRDNSLLIMLGNSSLFSAVFLVLWSTRSNCVKRERSERRDR